MIPRRIVLPTALVSLVALTGCQAGSLAAPSTAPSPSALAEVTTDPACPATATLPSPPERIVTMDAGAAAFLIELGFGDKIVGTAAPDFKLDFTGDLREKLDALPVLDPGFGSAETTIAAQPDLVVGISEYEFGRFQGTATVEQLQAAGAAAISACSAVQDGEMTNIDETYRFIASLSAALGVESRGAALIERIRTEVAAAGEAGRGKDVSVLTLSGVPDAGVGVRTSGGSSFANGIVNLAGGAHIARSQLQDFTTLSAEQVAASDPSVIVVVTGFSPESDEALTAAIAASPLLAETTAVRTGNIVVVPQRTLLSPSLRNADAVQTIADAIARA